MNVSATLEYKKLRQIGVGQGMNSTVHLARDPQLGGEVVVKEIPLANFGNQLATYFREAQAMFAADHQNVVPVHYAGTTATDICIAMPFYPKGSLADELRAGPLLVSRALIIGQDVLSGLARIHVGGYIHFDVKPSNVLISDTGRGMVADFGQSREIAAGGVVVNVPHLYWTCVPPERFAGPVTLLADVYQVGLLLYRAVNGEQEWNRQLPADALKLPPLIQKGRFPDRRLFLPHVPDRLRRVIRKALSVDPTDRFASATEFADVLGRVAPKPDWRCTPAPNDEMSWRAPRPSQPELVVELRRKGAAWAVSVYTDNGGSRRARQKDALWATCTTLKEARRHLTAVFKALP